MNEKAKCTDKMIEEMAKDLKECLPNNWYWQKTVDSDTYFVAKHFYNEGYRNCKDKVVLDKHEHQKYCAYKIIEPQIKGCLDRERELERKLKGLKEENHTLRLENNDLEAQVEQARKETAEKTIKWFKENSVCIPSDEDINEFAKQFGVEVEK